MIRSFLNPYSILSQRRAGNLLSIFIFHRVVEQPDAMLPDIPDKVQFEKIIRFIGRSFTPISLGKAISALKAGNLPPAAAAVTFDDGYADNLHVAAPILAKYRIPATFFIATGFTEGGLMWNDYLCESLRTFTHGAIDLSEFNLGKPELTDISSRRKTFEKLRDTLKYLPHEQRMSTAQSIAAKSNYSPSKRLMLSRDDLITLLDMEMEIGGHTISHPILSLLEEKKAREEICGCREDLEAWLGIKIKLFAYPNGRPRTDYLDRDVSFARDAGYEAAVSTHHGVAWKGSDMYQLPRFTPWNRNLALFALRSANNLMKTQ